MRLKMMHAEETGEPRGDISRVKLARKSNLPALHFCQTYIYIYIYIYVYLFIFIILLIARKISSPTAVSFRRSRAISLNIVSAVKNNALISRIYADHLR